MIIHHAFQKQYGAKMQWLKMLMLPVSGHFNVCRRPSRPSSMEVSHIATTAWRKKPQGLLCGSSAAAGNTCAVNTSGIALNIAAQEAAAAKVTRTQRGSGQLCVII